jgi:GntR family transcriptional regulator
MGAGRSVNTDRRKLPFQIKDAIRELIEAEGYGPGTHLPSHDELAARWSVARSIVREALKLLEADGLVEIRHGSGTYLSTLPHVDRPITRLEGMTEFLQSQGYTVTDRILGVCVRPASDGETAALGLAAGAEVIALERARLEGDRALIYSEVVMPRSLVPGDWVQMDWSRPLLGVFDGLGHRIAATMSRVSASHLPRRIARELGVRPMLPFIVLDQRAVDDARRPVMLARDYYRSDLFSFSVFRQREG